MLTFTRNNPHPLRSNTNRNSMENQSKNTIITQNVWVLLLVSLFTDVASEMLYPIMPVYLKSIGFLLY